jgi:hypothetical protein
MRAGQVRPTEFGVEQRAQAGLEQLVVGSDENVHGMSSFMGDRVSAGLFCESWAALANATDAAQRRKRDPPGEISG